MAVTLTIVAENKVALSKGLIGEHGFCAFLETEGKKILWDTGQGLCIKQNPRMLGIDLKKIDVIALSHGHFDHTGGLEHVILTRGGAEVVCHPSCFDVKKARRVMFGKTIEVQIGIPFQRHDLEMAGARFTFTDSRHELAPGVHFFTGIPMTNDFEQLEPGFLVDMDGAFVRDELMDDAALAVVTDKGLSVILGCAHRGMINTIRHIKKKLRIDKVHSVWGGTHVIDRTPEQLQAAIEALRELGVEKIGACHCTGFENELRMAAALPGRFQPAHVGVRVEL